MHKPLFPSTVREDVGFGVLAAIMGLCNVAGIGGGAIDVPLVMFFFVFGTKEAVALSSMIILFGAITRYIIQINERNPNKQHCVVIDYSVATIMIATTLAGTQIGVIVLRIFP